MTSSIPQQERSAILSVVMPCYNEVATITAIIDAVLASDFVGELVVVDDASTDGTTQLLAEIRDPRVRVFTHAVNSGKGAALRTGFASVGDFPYVVIQDADLEYSPAEYSKLLGPVLDDRADVVFGSRFQGGDGHRVLYFWHMVGNRILTLLSNAMTNLNLTDMETCYKLFRRDILTQLVIEENRFGIEPELTAKVARLGCRIYEVGITYDGRSYAEGKKIGWRDGIRAAFCIAAYSRIGERIRLRSATRLPKSPASPELFAGSRRPADGDGQLSPSLTSADTVPGPLRRERSRLGSLR
jgi:glycosyltransferase involved in cell wall biosynthesis